jgi:hypothetical protein
MDVGTGSMKNKKYLDSNKCDITKDLLEAL